MKVKASELNGRALLWSFYKAKWRDVEALEDMVEPTLDSILKENRVGVIPSCGEAWEAFFYLPYEDGLVRQGGVSSRQIGAMPVIAAMRTIVTHYIGYEIYLPDELELLK